MDTSVFRWPSLSLPMVRLCMWVMQKSVPLFAYPSRVASVNWWLESMHGVSPLIPMGSCSRSRLTRKQFNELIPALVTWRFSLVIALINSPTPFVGLVKKVLSPTPTARQFGDSLRMVRQRSGTRVLRLSVQWESHPPDPLSWWLTQS